MTPEQLAIKNVGKQVLQKKLTKKKPQAVINIFIKFSSDMFQVSEAESRLT